LTRVSTFMVIRPFLVASPIRGRLPHEGARIK